MKKEQLPCTHDQASVEYIIRLTLTQKVRFSARHFTPEELCTRLRVSADELESFLSEYTDMSRRPDIVKLMRVADALNVHMSFEAETVEEIESKHRQLEIFLQNPDVIV